jgi:hypothetical protein
VRDEPGPLGRAEHGTVRHRDRRSPFLVNEAHDRRVIGVRQWPDLDWIFLHFPMMPGIPIRTSVSDCDDFGIV